MSSGGLPGLSDEKRCKAILDAETNRRCPCPIAPNNDGFCHAHGPNAKEWHSKGGKAGGAVRKKLWQDRKKQAAALKLARSWEGYATLVLAQIKDEYDQGVPDKKALGVWLQRLEKALEHIADQSGVDLRPILGELTEPDKPRPVP